MKLKIILMLLGLLLLAACQSSSQSNQCSPTTWTPAASTVCSDQVVAQSSNCGTSRQALGTKICSSPEENQTGQYTFEYDEDKLSGFYTVPCYYVPKDKLQYCDVCQPAGGGCGLIDDDRDLYTINEGYTEDFTYQSDYPIYGAWEIRNYGGPGQDDFSDKCFVGDCTKENIRDVVCFDENNLPNFERFVCDKWVLPIPEGNHRGEWCVDNEYFRFNTPYVDGRQLENSFSGISCSKPKIINYYYAYNEWPGYEGYDPNWKEDWQTAHDLMNQFLVKYNINLQANFYEYKIPDNSALPGTLMNDLTNQGVFKAGDLQFTIFAGTKVPLDYGVSCDYAPANPCSMNSAMRGGDYRMNNPLTGWESLVHEVGHKLGCPHTGSEGSFAAHLYSNDLMSYGTDFGDFLYECRIAMWYWGMSQ